VWAARKASAIQEENPEALTRVSLPVFFCIARIERGDSKKRGIETVTQALIDTALQAFFS
jgi:hypothetical protein